MDQKTDLTKLWRTINYGSAKRQADNEHFLNVFLYFNDWQSHFFKRDPISNKEHQEETLEDGTEFHRRSSNLNKQELQK